MRSPVLLDQPIGFTPDGKPIRMSPYLYSVLSKFIGTNIAGQTLEPQEIKDGLASATALAEFASMPVIEQSIRQAASFSAPESMQPTPQEQSLAETYQGAGSDNLLDMIVWAPRED